MHLAFHRLDYDETLDSLRSLSTDGDVSLMPTVTSLHFRSTVNSLPCILLALLALGCSQKSLPSSLTLLSVCSSDDRMTGLSLYS